jgi:hypothetical protein
MHSRSDDAKPPLAGIKTIMAAPTEATRRDFHTER